MQDGQYSGGRKLINDTVTENAAINWKNHTARHLKDRLAKWVSFAILGIMAAVLISIFAYIIGNGASFVSFRILTTNGSATQGGIANSIIGTWILVGVGLLFSLVPGVFGSLYLVNRRSIGKVVKAERFLTDILTSIPSIILGIFGYFVLVIQLGLGLSFLAGGITLGIMMLPYVMRITEISYRNIPIAQVENAYALGADSISVASRIYLPQAMRGILSGALLAVSIAAGETAQLLYTDSFNSLLPHTLTGAGSATGYLTFIVWYGIQTGTIYGQKLAYVAAMILIVTIAGLILLSKYVINRRN